LLAIGRTETGAAQFQMVSTDYGKTWKRSPTNIGDVQASTPSLIFDAETGLVSNYYYQRGKAGLLRRRVVAPDRVFSQPLDWPASEPVAAGSQITFDAGNANATALKGTHYVAFYSGKAPDTAILVAVLPAPNPARSGGR
ncbi:MAG: exo-alpha-sialidase, partial [Kiritimatiellaeota bacterium]|nr:exo-alpha-sialidase [Kiritimatiellota bacterium]